MRYIDHSVRTNTARELGSLRKESIPRCEHSSKDLESHVHHGLVALFEDLVDLLRRQILVIVKADLHHRSSAATAKALN